MSVVINNYLTPEETGKIIADRMKQYRILRGITQEKLADMALVSVRTVKRFEAGEEIGFLKFIRLIKALGLDGGLEMLIPDQSMRPSLHIQTYKPRQRAVPAKKKDPEWKWGDET